MGLEDSIIFHVVYDWINIIIIVTFSIFHILRLHYNSKIREEGHSKFKLKQLTYLILILNVINLTKKSVLYLPAAISSNDYMTNNICYWHGRYIISMTILLKFCTHLFVVLRSRVAEQKLTIWVKIGKSVCCFTYY